MKINCSAQQFMELFLDLNHVTATHKGLNSFIDIRKALLEVEPNIVRQMVPLSSHEDLQGKYAKYGFLLQEHGFVGGHILWTAMFPFTTIETYPGLRVTTVVEDTDDGQCWVDVIFDPLTSDEALFEAAKEAYLETAHEDDILLDAIAFDQRTNGPANGSLHMLVKSTIPHYRNWMKENHV